MGGWGRGDSPALAVMCVKGENRLNFKMEEVGVRSSLVSKEVWCAFFNDDGQITVKRRTLIGATMRTGQLRGHVFVSPPRFVICSFFEYHIANQYF